MGWFDNEEGAETGNAPATGSAQRAAVKTAPPSPSGTEAGSTLGRHVHVDGTIVCGEDLTILGKVEGTIRAKGTLVIAEQADVKAKIDGQRVLVHGKVEGNVHGDEKVTLGPTAHLTGNIDVSILEVLEGAYLRGNVEMKAAQEAKAKSPTGAGTKPPDKQASKGPTSSVAVQKKASGAEPTAKQDPKAAGTKPSGGPGPS
jgi:cytoskeletal protein CcmA (bactofilin family)